MKLGLDPRLPQAGGPDSQRTMYARLYELFRSHAVAMNAVDEAGTKNSTDIAANTATLAGHTTDITANTAAIVQNTTDIASKASQSAFLELLNNAAWYGKAVGEVFYINESLGAPIPPKTNPNFRFVRLTAADAYNSGALTAESVSGTSPLVVATAQIVGGPLNGKTVHLLNTEGRFIRSGVSGVLQDDALQNITGELRAFGDGATGTTGAFTRPTILLNTSAGAGGAFGAGTYSFDASRAARTANETRARNIGLSAWMRVL